MPIFRKFEGPNSVTRSKRHLPHWTAEGVTQFVTFRLADSIPIHAAEKMERRRREWLSTQGIEDGDASFLPTAELRFQYRKRFGREFHGYLDKGYGDCLLKKETSLDAMEGALRHFDGDRYDLGDFVVMPNHVHVLLVPLAENLLSDILHSWKSFTAKVINRIEERTGAFWQKENYDHIVRTCDELARIRRYIKTNPEKAGLSEKGYRSYEATWEEA